MNNTNKGRISPLVIILIVIVVGALFFLFRGAGSSSVELSVPRAGSRIFVDNMRHAVTEENNETVTISTDAGTKSILVSKEGFWPWSKILLVGEGEVVRAYPFNVPEQTSGVIITEEDPEYEDIVWSVENAPTPEPDNKFTSPDGSVALWSQEGVITGEWLGDDEDAPAYFCPERTDETAPCFASILNINAEPQGLDFYPGYNNVAIFGLDTSIYAVEFDRRGTQNFQPIYEGTAPRFKVSDEGTLYVKDGDQLMEVAL